MSKYEPLGAFLKACSTQEIPLTFREIEKIVGMPLPASKKYPAWWSNNPSNNVMTQAWLDAGFRTERVDIGGERLVFRRESLPSKPLAGVEIGHVDSPREGSNLLDRLRARLGGTVTIAEGVDITAPTGEVWDAEIQ